MKGFVNGVRFFVGILFILSGLVKANDPLGLSYKMQEFFEVWNASFTSGSVISNVLHFLNNQSLTLSVIMIGLEIMAGVALIIGWQRKAVLGLLLGLIIFFTFLTGFAYWSGKFKNCGCFGDCLPITPLTSFLKDVLLLALILFLIWKQQWIEPLFKKSRQALLLAAALFVTFVLQWYALEYLPFVDCLPFKRGNSIAEQMKMPANAIPDSFAMKFIYERSGKRFEFAPSELPADLKNYKFIDRTQVLIRQGNAEPPIKGFSLVGLNGENFTDAILAEPKAVLVFVLDFKHTGDWIGDAMPLYKEAKKKNIPFFFVSADAARGKILVSGITNEDIQFLSCDFTAVRTAARTNPTAYILQKGVVVQKSSAGKIHYLIKNL